MSWKHTLPEWVNEGTEPSESLRTNGFQGGYKPPAAVFNWFWHSVSEAVNELQEKSFELSGEAIVPVEKGGTGKDDLGDVIVGGADWAEYASYLGMNDCSNKDLNTLKKSGFYFGYTGMTNAAVNGISVIEVIAYSNDWVLQRQTHLEDCKMYFRHFKLGTTWSQWYSIYTSKHKPTTAEIGAVSRSEYEANLLATATVEPKGV